MNFLIIAEVGSLRVSMCIVMSIYSFGYNVIWSYLLSINKLCCE